MMFVLLTCFSSLLGKCCHALHQDEIIHIFGSGGLWKVMIN